MIQHSDTVRQLIRFGNLDQEKHCAKLFIEGARTRIGQGWTQKVAARDSKGHQVQVDDQRACCWCVIGAMTRTRSDITGQMFPSVGSATPGWALAVLCINDVIRRQVKGQHCRYFWATEWNDAPGRTEADVLHIYDLALVSIDNIVLEELHV